MLQGIDNYLDDDLAPAAINKDDITHMMHRYDDVETPFGQIVSPFEFRPTPTDEPEPIKFLNPFALLWWLSQISYGVYTFLSKALPARSGRTVFYTDEVFPANSERRPDKGRAYYAFFWSIIELPEWFRSRSELTYFVFAYVPSKAIANQFSLTRLFKKIIHVFFSAARLQHGYNWCQDRAQEPTICAPTQIRCNNNGRRSIPSTTVSEGPFRHNAMPVMSEHCWKDGPL